MRKRAVFSPRGLGRPNLGLLREERGLTPVLGAVFVIAFVFIVLSMYLGQVVPP